MKKIYNVLIVLTIPAIFLLATGEMMYPSASPGGKTGSPGDGNNCTQCHTGTPINQEAWIWSSDLLIQGYTPGGTYNFFVYGIDPNAEKFGFEATAEDNDGNKVGSFQADVIGTTQTINDDKAITHTAFGTTPLADTGTVWMFTWTAPDEAVGPIGFYAAINAANGNNQSSGDQIHLTSMMVTPATGIFGKEVDNTFEMFPNPSYGIVNVGNETNKRGHIEVINLLGHVVFSSESLAGNNRLNLSFLEKGIYIVKVGDKSQRLILR